MKKLLILCTLLMAVSSSYSMNKNNSGTMSLPANARSICNGLNNVLKSIEPLNSSLAVGLWHNATTKHGLLDSSCLVDPLVTGAVAGGLIGTTAHAIITEESLNKTSPAIRPIVKVAAKHPFLVAYTGLHAWFRWNEIKNNPWPFIAELSLIGLHLYDESNY